MKKTGTLDLVGAAGIYRRLDDCFGNLHWWPGETRLEIILGAILTQNTAWTNVERCIRNLKREGLLSLSALRSVSTARLHRTIRPSGYFRQKSLKLKNFVRFIDKTFSGSLSRMARVETGLLRGLLLAVNGIGPETADSILLYAFGKPVFVVDAYTRRIFSRLGFLSGNEGYEDIRALFEKAVSGGVEKGLYCDPDTGPGPALCRVFNQYHALIVNTGKDFCASRTPHCAECPLKDFRGQGCLF